MALNRVDLGDSIAGKNLDMTMDRHPASSLSTYHHHQGDFGKIVDGAKLPGCKGPSGDCHL